MNQLLNALLLRSLLKVSVGMLDLHSRVALPKNGTGRVFEEKLVRIYPAIQCGVLALARTETRSKSPMMRLDEFLQYRYSFFTICYGGLKYRESVNTPYIIYFWRIALQTGTSVTATGVKMLNYVSYDLYKMRNSPYYITLRVSKKWG